MRRFLPLAVVVALLVLGASSVGADCPGGDLLINPHGSYYPLPVMLSSPATFSIKTADSTSAQYPHILLVMTGASLAGLTSPITVNWTGGSITIAIVSFEAATSGYIPPPRVTSYDSGRYDVENLKERLGVNATADDTLYWAIAPFLFGGAEGFRISGTEQFFTVTVPSTLPRVLVLALARTPCSTSFNMRVKPCTPGFIVPEPSTVLLVLSLFAALGLFAIRHVRHKDSAWP